MPRMPGSVVRWVLLVAVASGTARLAVAQSLDDEIHGPRFLLASAPPPAKAVLLDVSRTPVLRRRIALDLDEVTLKEALAVIGREAGLNLAYAQDVVSLQRRVALHADNITVAAALTDVLADTDVDVVFTPEGRAVLRKRVGAVPLEGGTIIGRVTDAKSAGRIANVEVFLEKTRWRTTTDTSGRYRLTDVDPGTYTLTVRRLGFAKQGRRVTVRTGQEDTVDVALEPVARKLEDLVTTATGRQRRRDLGNAITTIQADSVLQTAPIRNLTDLLENRVPGLTVQHTSGAPGDPARLRLRGLGSALRSNDPVVVVDGVRIYAAQSAARSGNLTNLDPGTGATAFQQHIRANPVDVPAPSPLDQIDPNTIEKIEVFKGPSAATLYGADAANGVIVITTKRGRPGPTRWDASITQARKTSPGRYPTGYYRWGHDMFTGDPRFCTLVDRRCLLDSLVQFQALNDPTLSVLGHGARTALSLTAAGGSQSLTYSITGSYGDEIGLLTLPQFEVGRFQSTFNRRPPDWMQRPQQLREWSVKSNVAARLNQSADVTLSTSLYRSEQQRTSLEQQLAPFEGTYIDTVNARYYRPSPGQYALSVTSAVLRDYYVRQTAGSVRFTTGLDANWHPRSWFTASGQAGLDVIPRNDDLLLPSGVISPVDSGGVVRGVGRSLVETFNLQGRARKPIGLGFVFTTNVGANLTSTTTNDLVTSASGLVPGTGSINGAQRVAAREEQSDASVYGWYIEPGISGQRISLSTGLRLDGGSAYGVRLTRSGGQGGILRGLLGLPKLNGSWVISEEPWFPFRSLFSSLRLRGAYGQAQVQPGPTDRLRLYTGAVDQGGSQLALTTLGNSQLRPERSTEFEGGLDADVLNSRASLEVTTYRKLQVDALMMVALPPSVHGGGNVLTNIGNIRNTGLELTARLTPVQSPVLTWSAELNYSRNSNVLVKLGSGVAPDKVQGLVEGYPVFGRWARPILGYADQNGDGFLQPQEIQVGDSLVYMGRLAPDYKTSLSTSVVLFGGAVRTTAGFSYISGATQIDQTARMNWVLARPLVDPSVPLSQQAAVLASTRSDDPTDYGLMQEVSTFRFNDLSVNYTVPPGIARRLRAQRLTIALQGSNLAMHSNYQGKDPDVNAWGPGEGVMDTGQLPQPRTWQIAVFLQY